MGANLSAAEQRSLALLNEVRANAGLKPVRASADLSASARKWAEEMRRSGFRHSPNSSLNALLGGKRTSLGENIVFWSDGNATPDAIAARFNEMWVNSPGHYRNMTNAAWTEVGVGFYRDASGWWGVHQFANG